MAELKFPSKRRLSGGFTLIETMIAMFIFAVGILSLAALMTAVNLNTDRSRYTSTATLLATEKLEDLNRYPAQSTSTAVSAGGSITGDVIGYYDNVQVQSDNGTITEITYNADLGCYDTFTHSIGTTSVPGTATDTGTSPCISTAPAALSNALNFHRRWLVENPITLPSGTSVDVHRITVWISLWAPGANSAMNFQGQPITFQLSTVRP
jgi:prepilin-type N-terminal cleavage/methylation domain-containing protein